MPNVTAIYQVADGLQGGLDIETRFGGKYTHVFQVEFDGTNGSLWYAIAAVNLADSIPSDEVFAIPEYGTPHPEDETSFVVEKTADPVPDSWGRVWKVTVRFAFPKGLTQGTGGGPPAPSDNQGNEPPFPLPNTHRSWSSWTRQLAKRRAYPLVNLVTNSAGDPFSPPLTVEDHLPQVTFVRSQTTFNPKWKSEFEDRLNDRDFKIWSTPEWTAPKWSLKVISITGDETAATGKTPAWWTVTIVIQYNPDLWVEKPLDQGGRYLVAGVKTKCLTNGVPVVALLDGAGGRLADGGTPVFLDGIAPATKGPYRLNLDADFRGLALTV